MSKALIDLKHGRVEVQGQAEVGLDAQPLHCGQGLERGGVERIAGIFGQLRGVLRQRGAGTKDDGGQSVGAVLEGPEAAFLHGSFEILEFVADHEVLAVAQGGQFHGEVFQPCLHLLAPDGVQGRHLGRGQVLAQEDAAIQELQVQVLHDFDQMVIVRRQEMEFARLKGRRVVGLAEAGHQGHRVRFQDKHLVGDGCAHADMVDAVAQVAAHDEGRSGLGFFLGQPIIIKRRSGHGFEHAFAIGQPHIQQVPLVMEDSGFDLGRIDRRRVKPLREFRGEVPQGLDIGFQMGKQRHVTVLLLVDDSCCARIVQLPCRAFGFAVQVNQR